MGELRRLPVTHREGPPNFLLWALLGLAAWALLLGLVLAGMAVEGLL